ncbi:GntR family transcriptional regulator [Marinivivus vitaminiproducens]|uniref:GntR family transcriptional regulator n=1 Tax=Marinivivus vitaminiproducens TaxID=3035935 RepID=UPI0027AB8DFD|nr:GntR family transcriptional regulator [Geminicoccaceae bacterium SCSIO 64248]
MKLATAIQTIAPLERDTLGRRAYAELRHLIMAGRIDPGEHLSLRTVAQALGTSVMPVREAVSRLVAEQALEVAPNRAVRVPHLGAARFRELTAIRIEIEGFATEQAAARRTRDDLKGMAEAEAAFRSESLSATPDLAKAVAMNMDFHFAVYRAAAMPSLVEIIESLWLRIGPVINLETRGNPQRLMTGGAYRRHRLALRAIRRQDGPAARAAIAEDIRVTAEFLLARGDLGPAA